jgi:hypothetical protein
MRNQSLLDRAIEDRETLRLLRLENDALRAELAEFRESKRLREDTDPQPLVVLPNPCDDIAPGALERRRMVPV